MEEPRPSGRKMRSYTLAALLAVFVGAAVIAVASRLLPRRLSRLFQAQTGSGHGGAAGDQARLT
jgi:hypothetical protein